ncbi:MAG: NAD(P)-dependent oxidoreductase [Pseudomonadota bacterium]
MSNCKPIVPEALAGQTLCLTGFSGYVGKHLVSTLVDAGVRPFLIGRPGHTLEPMAGADVAVRWDSSQELATQLAQLVNPVVLNIAGHFVSRHSSSDIPPLVAGNLEFPIKIFEAVALSRTTRIVNVGTSWEYSDQGSPEPANLYAQLKASNAAALEWYARQFEFQALNVKLNDTYGGNDTRAKLMPLLHACATDGQPAALNAWAQRLNLLHIVDVQEGLLAAVIHTASITPGTVQTAFLLGDETVTVGALMERIQAGPAPLLSFSFKDTRLENPELRDVWAAAPQLPNWRPRISLEVGLDDYFGSIK